MPQPAVKRAHHRDKIVPSSPATSTWDKAVRAFLVECRRKNLSASTRQNYEWYLRGTRMTAFVKDHAITSPTQMDSDMLRTFEGELFAAEGKLATQVGDPLPEVWVSLSDGTEKMLFAA